MAADAPTDAGAQVNTERIRGGRHALARPRRHGRVRGRQHGYLQLGLGGRPGAGRTSRSLLGEPVLAHDGCPFLDRQFGHARCNWRLRAAPAGAEAFGHLGRNRQQRLEA